MDRPTPKRVGRSVLWFTVAIAFLALAIAASVSLRGTGDGKTHFAWPKHEEIRLAGLYLGFFSASVAFGVSIAVFLPDDAKHWLRMAISVGLPVVLCVMWMIS
jgi:hypothetical protein